MQDNSLSKTFPGESGIPSDIQLLLKLIFNVVKFLNFARVLRSIM